MLEDYGQVYKWAINSALPRRKHRAHWKDRIGSSQKEKHQKQEIFGPFQNEGSSQGEIELVDVILLLLLQVKKSQ